MRKNNIEILDKKILNKLSNIYKIIGDQTRLKIICILNNNELCVCDICSALNMTQSAVSHQLATLRKYKLVKSNKRGKEVYYSLEDSHINELIELTLTHIKEDEHE